MGALVRAELLKLRTVTTTGWLLLASLGVVAVELLGVLLSAKEGNGYGEVGDPQMLSYGFAGAAAGDVVVLVLGVLAMTHEFRFGTATPTFLVTPRRGQVLVAKLVAVGVVGVGYALAALVVGVPLSVLIVHGRGGIVRWDARLPEVLAAVPVILLLYGMLGVAVGSLVRNQVAAVAASLVWLFAGEGVLALLEPDVEAWTPGGATNAMLQIGTWTTPDHNLPPWAGALVLAAWVALMAGLAARTTVRRDLN